MSGGAHRFDRLAGLAARLVEAASEFGTEPQRQRRAWRSEQVCDTVEA
jgi:hypothetical protein